MSERIVTKRNFTYPFVAEQYVNVSKCLEVEKPKVQYKLLNLNSLDQLENFQKNEFRGRCYFTRNC